jgi:peptidyl-prolyl cis-trans isomerase C
MGTPTFEETAPQLRQEMAREVVLALVADLRADAEIERFNLDGSPMPAAPEAGPEAAEEPQAEPSEAEEEPE